jgi:hypothetical protein
MARRQLEKGGQKIGGESSRVKVSQYVEIFGVSRT